MIFFIMPSRIFTLNYRSIFSLFNFRYAGTSLQKGCWKCGQTFTSNLIFCSKCQVIQPIYTDDFFSYFGIKKSFSILEGDLKQRFRQLQSKVHPDKFGMSSLKEKEYSELHSSFLNQAFKTLIDPRTRAQYILKLENKDQPIHDNEFASEIMELNEQIEEMEDHSEIENSLTDIQSRIKSLADSLEDNFQKGDYDEANKSLYRLSFYERTKKLLLKKLK